MVSIRENENMKLGYHITIDGKPYCETPSEIMRLHKERSGIEEPWYCGHKTEEDARRQVIQMKPEYLGVIEIVNGLCPNTFKDKK